MTAPDRSALARILATLTGCDPPLKEWAGSTTFAGFDPSAACGLIFEEKRIGYRAATGSTLWHAWRTEPASAHPDGTVREARTITPTEAWELLAERGVINADAVGDPRRGFWCSHCEGKTIDVTKPADAVRIPDWACACQGRGYTDAPTTLPEVVALASAWPTVLAAEELARGFADDVVVVWRVAPRKAIAEALDRNCRWMSDGDDGPASLYAFEASIVDALGSVVDFRVVGDQCPITTDRAETVWPALRAMSHMDVHPLNVSESRVVLAVEAL